MGRRREVYDLIGAGVREEFEVEDLVDSINQPKTCREGCEGSGCRVRLPAAQSQLGFWETVIDASENFRDRTDTILLTTKNTTVACRPRNAPKPSICMCMFDVAQKSHR